MRVDQQAWHTEQVEAASQPSATVSDGKTGHLVSPQVSGQDGRLTPIPQKETGTDRKWPRLLSILDWNSAKAAGPSRGADPQGSVEERMDHQCTCHLPEGKPNLKEHQGQPKI